MRWFPDDIRFLEKIIAAGRIEYALHLLQRYPGLPKNAAADLYRWLSQWQPPASRNRHYRSQLLHRLRQLQRCEQQQQNLFALLG